MANKVQPDTTEVHTTMQIINFKKFTKTPLKDQLSADKKKPRDAGFFVLAEQEGFEPSIRYNRIPDFESGAFDHSAIAPEYLSSLGF